MCLRVPVICAHHVWNYKITVELSRINDFDFVCIYCLTHPRIEKKPESDVERVEKRIAERKIVSKLIYFPFISYQIWWSIRRQRECRVNWSTKHIVDLIRVRIFVTAFYYIRLEAVTWAERNILKQISFPAANNNENWFDFFDSIYSPFNHKIRVQNWICHKFYGSKREILIDFIFDLGLKEWGMSK